MDVALRIVNVLLALDLFRDAGATFDRPFLDLVTRSTAEHARHIVEALEWAEAGRGNHYLSDILGLLFAAAYLPRSPETDAWLAFATREFLAKPSFSSSTTAATSRLRPPTTAFRANFSRSGRRSWPG